MKERFSKDIIGWKNIGQETSQKKTKSVNSKEILKKIKKIQTVIESNC